MFRHQNLLDPQALHAVPGLVAIDLVTITHEIGWRGVVREGLDELLGRPGGGGMLGDVEVDYAPAVVGAHNENEQDTAGDGALGDVDAELEELAVDARGAPERIRGGHLPDQGGDLGVEGRAPSGRTAGEP